MSGSYKQFGLGAISGTDGSVRARAARALATLFEPAYAGVVRARNAAYDRGLLHAHALGRPVVSVGNITTGGTGKTPIVQWLAQELRRAGHRPAVLLRGYGATAGAASDEATLLQQALAADGLPVPVGVNPSRVAGAAVVLRAHPEVDVFLLDDGYQHRRAARDMNLVLINATEPFGYGHVLPRGLLREPLSGLRRADAFVLTRCDQCEPAERERIEGVLRSRQPAAPIYHARHDHKDVWWPTEDRAAQVGSLSDVPFYAVAAIGDPAAFDRQLQRFGPAYTGGTWFGDHHRYTDADVQAVRAAAAARAATRVVTTGKDWVKLSTLPSVNNAELPIGVVRLELAFEGDDAARLVEQTLTCMAVAQKQRAEKGRTVEG